MAQPDRLRFDLISQIKGFPLLTDILPIGILPLPDKLINRNDTRTKEPMKPATIPKSLHTVTVIVAVARLIADQNSSNDHAANVAGALYVLGYENTADSYALAAKAAAIHAKDAPVRRAVKVAA